MTWMQTLTGTAFSLAEPDPAFVNFEEIAHALSFLCRFAGHTKDFYSVAEHSCRVSDILPQPLKAYGLLHDAHEAFIGDQTTPLKMSIGAEAARAFESVENLLQHAINLAAGLDPEPHKAIVGAVKYADLVLLMTERRDLMAAPQRDWGDNEKILPLDERIVSWNPSKARAEFLQRLYALLPQLVSPAARSVEDFRRVPRHVHLNIQDGVRPIRPPLENYKLDAPVPHPDDPRRFDSLKKLARRGETVPEALRRLDILPTP